jgi:outer membrane lipoprotein-sorting protein
MTHRTLLIVAACIMQALAMAGLAASAQPSQGGSLPLIDSAEEQAKAIEARAEAAYAALRSYQHTCKSEDRFVSADGKTSGSYPSIDEGWAVDLVFSRPNRFVVSGGHTAVYCDGRHVWVYRSDLGEYTESRVPDNLSDPSVYFELFDTLARVYRLQG